MGRLIFVSNRLPYTIRRHGNDFTLTRSSGGLVSGVGPIHESQDSLWIGNLGGEVEGLRGAELERQRLVPVTLRGRISPLVGVYSRRRSMFL